MDGRFDVAIRRLTEAVGPRSDNSSLALDLASAYLGRGLALDRPADLAEALDRIGSRPSDPAAMFNRAVALEALYLYRISARAWEAYLVEDPDSSWAEDARERLAGIRRVIEELDRSLDSSSEAGSEAGGVEPEADPILATAVALLRDGRDALARFDLETALARFEEASRRLTEVGDPRRWEAEAGIAQADHLLQRLDRAEERAVRVIAEARLRGDAALEARCLGVLAQLNLGRLSLQEALDHALRRRELGVATGDHQVVASAALTASRALDELGDPEAAWDYRIESFRTYAEARDGRRLGLTISNSSVALARQGKPRAAYDFASEMLEVDRALGDPVGLVESHWLRASHGAEARDFEAALDDLAEADSHLDRIESESLRARYDTNLRAVEGAILQEIDPDRAVSVLTATLSRLRSIDYEYGQSEILLERARALRRLARLDKAARDLAAASRMIAAQRGRIERPVLRVSFFDLQAELADEAVAVAVERGKPTEAFELAERAKGVLLRESVVSADRGSSTDQVAVWRRALGPEDALIAYWSLPKELLIWSLRADGEPELQRLPISKLALGEWLAGWTDALARGLPDLSMAARAHDMLLRPVSARLTGARRLIVVPDRVTRGVPWGALLEAATGERLIERFVVRALPTASGLGEGPLDPSGVGYDDVLVALGDPRLGGFAPPLAEARQEVEAIAPLFGRSTVLVGGEATKTGFLDALSGASVVHVASHFESGARPWSTWIPLAPESGSRIGTLAVSEIAGLDLSGIRLAVLSGCATQREGRPSLEGTFSAAGAFLAAGAGEVVASLWPVEDRTTAELMAELYPRLLRGLGTDEALREAQLALAARDGSPIRSTDWAAFQVISLRPPAKATGN